MRGLLNRLALRKDIGIAVGDREVAFSQVATTPLGRVEVLRGRVAIDEEGLASAIRRLLEAHFSRRDLARARVSIGLSALRVFFSTRPVQAEHREASAEVLLHEVLQSPSLNIDDMVVDLIRLRPGQRPLVSLIACRKKYLTGVLSALEACGVEPCQAEPSASALIRDAEKRIRPPRKSRAFVRVFLGPDQGLAVLMTGADLPLIWRGFGLPTGREAAAILAAVAGLGTLGRYCGLEGEVDAVLIHGRPDLGPLAEVVEGPTLREANARLSRHDLPALDEEAAALGLAEGPGPGVASFNLIRSFGRGLSFFEVFPWGQAVLQAALLIGATLFLRARLGDARAGALAAKGEDAKFAFAAKIPRDKLEAERKDLDQRVESVRKFLETRLLWTPYARGLADRLAPEITLASLQGAYEMESTGKGSAGKPKRSLVLKLQAPIPRTGAMPREIDAFLRGLRDDPLLKRDFPEIELSDLRWTVVDRGRAVANFSVTCQPAAKAAPPPPARPKPK